MASQPYVLVTIHRAANADDPARLGRLVEALREVGRNVRVVFPVHPRTRAALRRAVIEIAEPSITLLPPAGYLDMMTLVAHAAVVATDSGGLQKEAFYFGIPCVTLRDETEWVELVGTGWNRLASPDLSPREIATQILDAIGRRGQEGELYGGGRAARTIGQILLSQHGTRSSTCSEQPGNQP